jgi:hypothetical protein
MVVDGKGLDEQLSRWNFWLGFREKKDTRSAGFRLVAHVCKFRCGQHGDILDAFWTKIRV